MKAKLFFAALLLCGLQGLQAQSWVIQGNIENAEEGPVLLASYYGDRFRVVDSIDVRSGFFYFMCSEASPRGIYRIIYADRVDGIRSQNRFVEFIFNRENIEINVPSADGNVLPYFEGSEENRVYSGFMEFELGYEERLMAVYRQLSTLPSGEYEQEAVEGEYNALQQERNHYMDSITGLYPDLYAVRIMNAFRSPLIPGEMGHLRRIDTLKQCFFNHAAIEDPALLNAPVYTFKLIDYLSLYKVDSLGKEEQEKEFIKAVDHIMVNVFGNEELRTFVVEFLLQGFEMLDMEQVQMHIADQYLDVACKSDVEELILSRMEGYKKMAPGETAPDIVLRDTEGTNHQLSDIPEDYVLVIFWASSCDHCRDMLPELQRWYLSEENFGVEVLSISIDTSLTDFERYMEQLDPQWITAHDPLGWYGKVSSDYHIYATPSLFLLDKERSIIARPSSFRQFNRAVKKLGD